MYYENDPTAFDIDFDPRTERMRGIAVHGSTPFDTTFISNITDNLWQGGCDSELDLPKNIQHVISMYPWEDYRHGVLDTHIQVRMYDAVGKVDADMVDWLARAVNRCLETGEDTLVHCQAGLNRSSLVAARSLMLRKEHPLTAREAIHLIRESRSPACLCNPAFEEWLLSQ